MKGFKEQDFTERRNAAAAAKQAALSRFAVRPGPDDPAVIARAAERREIIEARQARAANRLAAERAQEETTRLAAEALAAAKEAERIVQAEREAAERTARDAARQAELKVVRDARYAARKNAKKKRQRGL